MANDSNRILLMKTDLKKKLDISKMIEYYDVETNHIRVMFHRTPVSFCDVFVCPDEYCVEYRQWVNRSTAFFDTAAGVVTVLETAMRVSKYMEICQQTVIPYIEGYSTTGLCDSDPKPLHAVARILNHRHVHWRRGTLPSIVILKDGERAGLVVRWEDDKYKLARTPSPDHGEPYDIEYGLACRLCDSIENFLYHDSKPSVAPYGAYDKLKEHFFKHPGYKYITPDLVKVADPPFTIDNKPHLSVSYLNVPVCDIRCDVLENNRCGYIVSFAEPFLIPTGYKPYKDTYHLVAFPYTDKSLYDVVSILGCINISIDAFNQRLHQYRVNMLQAIKGVLLSKKYENISFYEFESQTTNDGIKICYRGQSVCSIVAETEISESFSGKDFIIFALYRITYYTPFDQLRAVGDTITFSHVAHIVGNTRDNLKQIAMDVLKDIDDCISIINKEEKDNMASVETPVSNTLHGLYTRINNVAKPNLEVRTYINSISSENCKWMNIYHDGVKLFEAFGNVSGFTKDDLLVVCYDSNNMDTGCFHDTSSALDWIVEKTNKYDEEEHDKRRAKAVQMDSYVFGNSHELFVPVPTKIETGKTMLYVGRRSGKTAFLTEMYKHLSDCLKIENVIFSEPATIVFWGDGSKTVVKAQNEDFDLEKGLAMAISKKVYGNDHGYYEPFKKWIGKYKKRSKQIKKFMDALDGESETKNPREGVSFQDYLAEQLKDPEFKKEYENCDIGDGKSFNTEGVKTDEV